MRIQYIQHSGFLVEFEKAVFIFDYWKGDMELPDKEKKIYFFVSHKHPDHFSFDIFNYAKEYQDITFILPSDMKMNQNYLERRQVPVEARDKIVYAHKNSQFTVALGIEVETLTSTDEGVAYLVTYCEEGMAQPVHLYHAGDLNWWTWIGESKEEYADMTGRFKKEMEKLKGRTFDVAFVPLDPRQEERFWWGLDAFMKAADALAVVPMHCWEDYSVIGKLKAMEESASYRNRIVDVHQCGEWLQI